MSMANTKRLENFEMWVWQRMEKISWVDKVGVTKDSLQKVEETGVF